jgi:hypothetical protein
MLDQHTQTDEGHSSIAAVWEAQEVYSEYSTVPFVPGVTMQSFLRIDVVNAVAGSIVPGNSVYNKLNFFKRLVNTAFLLSRPPTLHSLVQPLAQSELEMLQEEHGLTLVQADRVTPPTEYGKAFLQHGHSHGSIDTLVLECATAEPYYPSSFLSEVTLMLAHSEPASLDYLNQMNNLLANIFDLLLAQEKQSRAGMTGVDLLLLKPAGATLSETEQEECKTAQFRGKCFDLIKGANEHFKIYQKRTRNEGRHQHIVAGGSVQEKVTKQRMPSPDDVETPKKLAAMREAMTTKTWDPLVKKIRSRLELNRGDSITDALSQGRHEELAREQRITTTTAANLATLIIFQWQMYLPLRLQVILESSIDEYSLTENNQGQACYELKMINRSFKTASAFPRGKLPPATKWLLHPEMNDMFTVYIVLGRPQLLKKGSDTTAMFLNMWGRARNTDSLLKEYNKLGMLHLGIQRFGPNVMRSLTLTLRLKDGSISESNIEQVASLLQTSTDTIRSSYMGSVYTPAMAQLSASLWEASAPKPSHEAAPTDSKQKKKPRGGPAAIKRARERWSEDVKVWKGQQKGEGLSISEAWSALCETYPQRLQESGELPAEVEWSRWTNTYLEDGKAGLKALREKMA